MSFEETLFISSIPALIAGFISFYMNRHQLLRYKADTMAERTATHYLKHRGYTDRKFETIKKYLGGWDKEEDELRKILVRAGAVRIFRREGGRNVEYWTLLSRTGERIENLKERSARKKRSRQRKNS